MAAAAVTASQAFEPGQLETGVLSEGAQVYLVPPSGLKFPNKALKARRRPFPTPDSLIKLRTVSAITARLRTADCPQSPDAVAEAVRLTTFPSFIFPFPFSPRRRSFAQTTSGGLRPGGAA